ncbi:RNA-binding protein 48 [Triplophysa dalaica]|uniref:RNA-binding protein 48 n=1 Tax=Triplophysa dalaica TaxID=1582913 RepID=UPI0024DF6FBC|nr:RNA-binding protein 48 [Triplophysa dalaica]
MDISVAKPSVWDTPKILKHHEQQDVAQTRPKYREGRRLKAVKVYTINLESRFLLVQGVPAIGVMTELVQLFALYGVIEEYRVLDEYPAEQFTEVYLFKFQKFTSARVAKRHTDEKSFFGGQLHVCYAPEYETVEETRQKLQDRRRYINRVNQKAANHHVQQQDESREIPKTETPTAATPDVQKDLKDIREENVNLDFSYLPSPPKNDLPHSRHSFQQSLRFQRTEMTLPTEDKMGSLYHYVPPVPDTSKHFTSCTSSSNKDKDLKHPSTSARFVPRIAHLESRKRKSVEELLFSKEMDKNGPMIGPKLPGMAKLDMEDESLNITANLIRQTITKVTCVPEIKPAQGKSTTSKPRRRI